MKNMGIAQHTYQTAKIKETENIKWFWECAATEFTDITDIHVSSTTPRETVWQHLKMPTTQIP